ncbi:oxidoreductase family protein [Sediminitomix flava]|uniref:Ecdysteroid kinase n=1 Tax=Sediminitomix flava TaxID=379075 RepID=A0A315ZC19_SEDFL|nr:oxidoreductase family protein [Sediminitomix flava]PWJ42274.1 ecdysteroid kinase [Sediminitomix flava]
MNEYFKSVILKSTNAKAIKESILIQNLWSGYGEILRIKLEEADVESVVIKHVKLPLDSAHPRGWNTDFSHQRKVKSYQVETYWYQHFAMNCDDECRIPKCLAFESKDGEVLMVLEDLDASGFPERKHSVSWTEIKSCLHWLANFHASFLGEKPTGLWEIGTYWHLDTRPDEFEELTDKDLKQYAKDIDEVLKNANFQTFVHGDAKLANFCFSSDGQKASAVDFQYVGGGCGMKDLVYFIGSCLNENECELYEQELLDIYFQELKKALEQKDSPINFDDLEKEWRTLFPYAWTDFHRFLKGWSPGHWKINSYSERLAREVVKDIKSKS